MIIISRLLTLICVPLVLLLLPILGMLGAALAFGLARVLAGMWATGSGYRLLGLRWPWRFSLRVVLASAIMAALVGRAERLPAACPISPRTAWRGWPLLPLLLVIAGVGGDQYSCSRCGCSAASIRRIAASSNT